MRHILKSVCRDMARHATTIVTLTVLLFITSTTFAQGDTPVPVTFDEVNEVASKMYCPVCENEPLDTCATATCVEWRSIIRDQLEAGRTEREVIDYFIANFGDRVVGIPEDSTLRFYSLLGPLIAIVLALGIGFRTFVRWRRRQQDAQPEKTMPAQSEDDIYRSRLESDLQY